MTEKKISSGSGNISTAMGGGGRKSAALTAVSIIVVAMVNSCDGWLMPTTSMRRSAGAVRLVHENKPAKTSATSPFGRIYGAADLMRLGYKIGDEDVKTSDKTDLMIDPTKEATENKLLDEDWCLRMMSTEVGVKKFLKQRTTPPDLPLDVVFERTLDTVEDVVIHMRRLPYDLGFTDVPYDETKVDRPTVVVLGTGWGAHAFVKVACTFDLRVIVVSPSNHFVFTPMLASAAVGTVEYRSMTEAIRSSNPTIDDFVDGKATAIDVANKELTVELTSLLVNVKDHKDPPPIKIKYDHLICSVGTRVRSSMVKGADQYCLNLKTCEDAKKLRTAVGETLEYASRPDVKGSDPEAVEERRRRATFVIVGGGPTGVELAGELSDFLRDTCRPRKGAYHKLLNDVKVVLVHGGSDLVPQFEPNLRAHALEALEKRGVEVRLDTYTTEVSERSVAIKDKNTGAEGAIPAGLTVWAAGNEPVPFIQELLSHLPDEARAPGGRVRVDKWLRCPTPTAESFGSILVLGDAAYFEDERMSNELSSSSTLPQTAQVAGQQGAFAARLLNREYDLSVTPPAIAPETDEFSKLRTWLIVRGLADAPGFIFLNLGLLAYVGGGEALSQIQLGDFPLFSYAGSVAYVLWRSVYLVKQVATRNRVLVTFDWIKSFLFGRDVTRL